MRKFMILLGLLSGTAWAESTNPPLSPPELIPATDHDPEHLSMFVTHFFRWWVDGGIRASETEGNAKDHAIIIREREEVLKTILMPSLWKAYQAYSQNPVSAGDASPTIPPLGPTAPFQAIWRETAYAKVNGVHQYNADLIAYFPSLFILAPSPKSIFYETDYRDRSSLYRVELQAYQGTWRIAHVQWTNW